MFVYLYLKYNVFYELVIESQVLILTVIFVRRYMLLSWLYLLRLCYVAISFKTMVPTAVNSVNI